MASVVLPKCIDYSQPSALPDGCTSSSIVVTPSNGSAFLQQSIIQIDLPTRSYLVPESMYLRFRVTYTGQTAASTGLTGTAVRGTPAYTIIGNRLETLCGSQTIESISNFSQLCNMVINTRMTYSAKLGVAYPFGYNSQSGVSGFDNSTNAPNGGYITGASGASVFYAIPLNCILSNANRLVPLKYCPQMRIQLTTESVANAIKPDTATAANSVTAFSISNVELCMDLVDFPSSVDAAIMARSNGMITIKSQSYLSSGTTLSAGSSGSLEFVYQQRLASVKSVFLHCSGTDLTVGGVGKQNLFFDSVDPTSNQGDIQFFIAQTPYPSRPLSTVINKAGIFWELSSAWGPSHDLLSTQFAINPTEFNYVNGSTTSINQMGKFYVATNTERLSQGNDALLTGVSSQGSPISVRLNISTGAPTTVAQVLQLIALYDVLLQIDMQARTLTVMQ